MGLKHLALAAVAAIGAMTALPASAQEDFFAGKQIELILPSEAGGSYGIYGLLLANHLPRHIPGNPAVVPSYMAGAGGMRASNYAYNVAAKDGLAMYMIHQNTATQQLLAPDQAQYDAAQMIPLAVISSMNSVMAVRRDLGIESVADIANQQVVTGSTGRGSYQFIVPTLLNEFLGTQFNIVTTYTGTSETMLAMERGEIGAMMTSLISLQESRPDWLGEDGLGKVILQMGESPDPALPDVPMLSSLAQDDEQAAIFRFLSISNAMARSVVLPPGVPEDRVAILRKAVEDTLADPEFIAAAEELGIPLVSASADDLGQIIADTLATPADVVTQTQQYITE